MKWIFITHEDQDNIGNLRQVMEAAPNARLVTNFVGLAKMSAETDWEIPMNRVFLLNPGQSFNTGDRKLTAVRPPLYDSSATNGLYDPRTETLITSDAFGRFTPAYSQDVGEVPEDAFQMGFTTFNRANHNWVSMVDPGKFEKELQSIRNLNPQAILSSHAPASRGRQEDLLKLMAGLPSMEPFVGPDQAALEAMLMQLEHGVAAD